MSQSKKSMAPRIAMAACVVIAWAISFAADDTGGHGLLETVEDVAVISLPVDGFQDLSLDDKLLAYHLYQAAVAGRDIQFAQVYKHNLSIRYLCEQILLHSADIETEILAAVASYLKQQFIHTGIHGARSYTKMLPPAPLDFPALVSAAKQAEKNGADFKLDKDLNLDEHLAELQQPIFDPDFDRFSTTRSPGPGEDLLSGSTVTFYADGLRLADLEDFVELYPLNSNIEKRNGELRELVWRIGDAKRVIPRGLYAGRLQAVVNHLEAAQVYATTANAAALGQLIEFYRTGDNADFSRYNIAWLAYKEPTVDTINGFIENYRDPLEKRGSWEGIVFFVNENTSAWLRQVAAKADYYESRAPFKDEYKRVGVKPIANMVEVLIETGDGGPISWSGINLPNESAVRQQHGSKNILLWNARRASKTVFGDRTINEAVWPADRELLRKHSAAGAEILVGFHEALGHASGQVSESLDGDPRDYLPGYYSWIEEERADLLALHHAWDPQTMQIRPDDWSEEAATALYKSYVALQPWGLAELPEGAPAIEETHQIGRNFAINYFMQKSQLIDVRTIKDGKDKKTYYVVPDAKIPAMREAVAELLAELQRIKSEGDLAAIQALEKKYGAKHYDQALANEMRARKESLKIPSDAAYVFPRLRLVMQAGQPVDVDISLPKSFLRQQMLWSGYSQDELSRIPPWIQ